jgi:hypothetical protein
VEVLGGRCYRRRVSLRHLRVSASASVVLLFALAARAGETVVLPLAVHIGGVVPEGFVTERVARTNEIFARYGVSFVVEKTVVLPAKHAALETRADRDALGAYAERGAIDCFVVGSLRDVDDPRELRRGVHWRSQTHEGMRYVIISSSSGPNVLAHELGHYLGNHAHSEVAGNLMSYTAGEGLPVLDAKQQKRLTRTVRELLKSGALTAHTGER